MTATFGPKIRRKMPMHNFSVRVLWFIGSCLKGKTEKNCLQGRLGNCWFCATAAALSSNVKLYAQKIQKLQSQTFDKSDYFGIFHCRFYHLGDWIDVVIDDYLPTIDGSLIFAHSKVEGAIKEFRSLKEVFFANIDLRKCKNK